MPSRGDVVAAGAVITRHAGREVLLVHRPKYDDWSFPKGKQDPGEHVTATAVREVREETGLRIRLGRPLPRQLYTVSGGKAKTVHYWVGRCRGGDDVASYAPNQEIDEVRWVPVDDAPGLLSYLDDIWLLESIADEPLRTGTLIVVRHAKALAREEWPEPDAERPLVDAGLEQAAAIAPVLNAYGVKRLVSSSSRRCVQTLRDYADQRHLEIEPVPGLSEEGVTDAALDTVAAGLLGTRRPTALCTHRPVLPRLLARLGIVEEPLSPSEMIVCHHRDEKIIAVERHQAR